MKYKELKKVAEIAGYKIVNGLTEYSIKHRYVDNSISISKESTNLIFIENELCRPQDFEVIKAAIALAETPPEERYDEKRYYLKHKFLFSGTNNYLNYVKSTKGRTLSSKSQTNYAQTQFTQKEINEIKEKYHTDLKDFEIIEVEEWKN